MIQESLSLIDTGSLHYRIRKIGSSIDYAKLLPMLPVGPKIAFGTDFNKSASPFINRLECLGYTTRFKTVMIVDGKPITTTCDVEIAIEAMQFGGNIYLVTSSWALIPLAKFLGDRVTVIGVEAGKIFPPEVNIMEIGPEVMR